MKYQIRITESQSYRPIEVEANTSKEAEEKAKMKLINDKSEYIMSVESVITIIEIGG